MTRPNPSTCACKQCGVAFVVPMSRALRGGGQFCSRACGGQFRSAHHPLPVADRFWPKVDRSGGPDACWPWMASTNSDGYGRFGLVTVPKTIGAGAHRVAWTLTNGPIPEGRWVLHQCDNPPCCNPAHLFLGTNSDNQRDAAAKGRHWTKRNPTMLAGDRNGSRRHPERMVRGGQSKASRLTDIQVLQIRARHAGGDTQDALASAYGVSQATIWRIVHRVNWQHL